ncbi:MAG: NADH-quinone oxidoreductase subunit K [Deltaproteobacteria bacterium]|jgi:multicomponent Na+:H+ antiporter subunit C
MQVSLAICAGIVLALALQALLRRSFLRMVIGFMLVSNAANLVIFTSGRLTRGMPPIIPAGAQTLEQAANPLPQALILTAIVISFGITAFAFALAFRVYRTLGTLDTDRLSEAETVADDTPDRAAEEELAA